MNVGTICPHCKHSRTDADDSTPAWVCPACGKKYYGESSAATAETKKQKGWPLAIVFSISVLSLAVFFSQGTDDGGARALTICQGAVKNVLKAPATALFSNPAISISDFSAAVGGDVDSQNEFGALVRSPYRCWLKRGAENQEWSLSDLSVN